MSNDKTDLIEHLAQEAFANATSHHTSPPMEPWDAQSEETRDAYRRVARALAQTVLAECAERCGARADRYSADMRQLKPGSTAHMNKIAERQAVRVCEMEFWRLRRQIDNGEKTVRCMHQGIKPGSKVRMTEAARTAAAVYPDTPQHGVNGDVGEVRSLNEEGGVLYAAVQWPDCDMVWVFVRVLEEVQ